MKYIQAIKDGFLLINRHWPLALIQAGLMFVSIVGFFIIVGIPLAIAFIIFGIDLTELANLADIFRVLRGPSNLLSKYIGLILIVLASFILYFLVVTMLGIYLFGGSIGVIGRAIREKTQRFTSRAFLDEAKRLFLRMLGFTSIIAIIFIVFFFVLGIFGGGVAALISYAQSLDSTLALFLVTFFSLILVIIALALIIGIISITLYGFATLYFKGTGAFKSIRESVNFLSRYPNGFWLYTVLFIGYLVASFFLGLISYPFTLVPVIGAFFSFMSYLFQTYLGLVLIAIIFSYYYSKEFAEEPAEQEVAGPGAATPEQEEQGPEESSLPE
jgi:hypothetical protein